MGSTLYSEHKVFKSDITVEDNALFGNGTVIVAAKRCEKNVYPHSYSWSIEFIGSEDTFINRYLPETAYFFDDGLSQAPYIRNGKQFQEYIKELYNTAGKISIKALNDLGFYGYNWPEDDIAKLGLTHDLKKFSYYLGTRFARVLKTEEDVEQLIREAYLMVPSTAKNIWLGCLWRLDFERSSIIDNALDGTKFDVL